MLDFLGYTLLLTISSKIMIFDTVYDDEARNKLATHLITLYTI